LSTGTRGADLVALYVEEKKTNPSFLKKNFKKKKKKGWIKTKSQP